MIKQTDLYEAIIKLQNSEECEAFFRDLCTPREIKDIKERWLVAQLLASGNYSYRDISKETGVSLSTITRVARFLFQESYNGYRMMINKLTQELK
jgi:TrpR-related protein YerC/YecD